MVVLMASMSSNLMVDAASATAYDILEQNKAPTGPPAAGREVVGSDQYHFKYGSTVGGVIKPGSITQVNGVRVFVKTEWLGFAGVQRAGDKLVFDLQGNSLPFPASSFTESPKCN
ncbi:unnamed protein product [Alopecurus aequalis]